MAIANPELMLNKMKCHTLEIIWKVSRAASQQLRRGFNVFAKSRLGNARWVPKEDLSSTYPSLDFRCLLIKSCIPTKWVVETLDRKKKMSFSTAFRPGGLLLQPFGNKCMFVSGVIRTGKPRGARRRFWCSLSTTTPPQKGQEPQSNALAGFFCPRLCGCPFLKYNFNNNFSSCKFFFQCLVLLRPLIRQTRAASWH